MSYSREYNWSDDSTLHAYILDYLNKRHYGKAAQCFADEAGLSVDSVPPIDTRQSLLYEWWSVFWAVFHAAEGRNRDNPAAVLYLSAVNNAKRTPMMGRAPIQPLNTPALPGVPPPAQMTQAQQVFAGGAPLRPQMPVNGHPMMQQGSPNPAMQARMAPVTAAQQQQQQQQQQRAMVQQQHPAGTVLRAGQAMPHQLSLGQQQLQQMAQQTFLQAQEQGLSREFTIDCTNHCYPGRDFESLSNQERQNVQSFMQSPDAQQVYAARLAQMNKAAGQSMYQNYATHNGAYYPNTMPSPNPNAQQQQPVYHAQSPASAPAMQQNFSAQATGTMTRRTTGRQTAPPAHTSAPPTPEMTSAAPVVAASPRVRKRPRTEASQTQLQQQQQQQQAVAGPSSQVNGAEPYAAPPRPASAAALRAQGGTASPSPRLPNSYANAQMTPQQQQQVLNEAEELARLQQNGLIGVKGSDRKRSPMAPPPVPSASSSQANIASTPRNDDASSQHDIVSGSPLQPNGLVGTPAPSQSDASLPQAYYHSSGGDANGDLMLDHFGVPNGSFNPDEGVDFDINSYLNIGEDFHGS